MNPIKIPYKALCLPLIIWFYIAALLGCGYHFQAAGEPVGIEIPSLSIPLMESTSLTLGFENNFTKAIKEEFIRHANVPLVSRDEAAMVLIGKVIEIKTVPLSYDIAQSTVLGTVTSYEVTDSRRIRIKVDAKLLERATGKAIWEEKGMEEKERYVVSTDPLTNRYNEKLAIKEIARRLADRMYLKTMERF